MSIITFTSIKIRKYVEKVEMDLPKWCAQTKSLVLENECRWKFT
ncbi:MAG: hypothetical protein ACUZ8N_00640 [Candidatus Scalindua sp.]